jgi:hypothetical protein
MPVILFGFEARALIFLATAGRRAASYQAAGELVASRGGRRLSP